MKAPTKPRWALTSEQARELRGLANAVDPGAGEGDPAFLALLEAWRGCNTPWDVRPLVFGYRCFGGEWLTRVAATLAAIRYHTLNDH